MTSVGSAASGSIWGSGLVCGADGLPLRPGGAALTEALLDLAGFDDDALVVDVGCGQGGSVAAMMRRGLLAVGVDVDAAAVEAARRRVGGAGILLASGDALPFATASVDGIVSECALSTMADRRRTLAEWRRVLRPGGRLALSDVYRRAAGPDQVTASADLSPLVSWHRLSGDLAEAGFRVEWFEDRSEVLRDWVARFVFANGSLEALWGGSCGLTAEAVRLAAPGYFLAIVDRDDAPRATSAAGEGRA
ncbi:SAM-dependent methyltransferase [Siculibacillus lacustris]|uniref:SAM-dependent methyltransferase n=1 Tax=Siculibacillus lacustris TaxID=1549641 RepID=A0A4Q9VN60_9HYPH|nr:class I SAM-dependent methyltransferase [Siculibacillus lacustris]TBW36126.1 SAM-dependent methyltransferase [Siculibacillus lacustris]